MKRLDRKRPFATVHGGEGSDIPHSFEQDGIYFNAEGVEVGRDPKYKAPRQATPDGQKTAREEELERALEAEREAARKKDEAREAELEELRKAIAALQQQPAPTGKEASENGVDKRARAEEEFERLTKAELHEHLKKAKVTFESDANKTRLVELAVEHALAK